MARYLLYVYFRLRKAHCFAKTGFRVRVSVRVAVNCRSGLLTTSFNDVIDFISFERQ